MSISTIKLNNNVRNRKGYNVNMLEFRHKTKQRFVAIITAFCSLLLALFGSLLGHASAAACPAPSADYGTVTSSVVIPSAATYRIWTRLQVPDTTNNSYSLQVDGTSCFSVGGSNTIKANTWTWVAFKDGNTASMIDTSLTKATHTLKLIGTKPDVKIDRLVFSSDTACVPKSADGSECNIPADGTAPVVQLTAPAANTTVNGTVTVSANATDNTGVTKVEFYVNNVLSNTDTTAPYSFSLNTTQLTNDSQLLGVAAYDAAGNVTRDSYRITVQNGDKQAPTAPTSLTATANAYNKVSLAWKAATDNIAVTGYSIVRDGLPINQVAGNVLAYADTTVVANTSYSYQIIALDGSANKSVASNTATVKTPVVADTQAPTAPAGLTAIAQSTQQINLNWTGSTDNTGIVGYDIYRAAGTTATSAQKINSKPINATSYADPNLTPDTTYAYYVKAVDGASNSSKASNTATAKTQSPPAPEDKTASINGIITDSRTKRPLTQRTNTKVVITENGHRYIVSPSSRTGVYVVRDLAPARYTASYRSDGYRTRSIYMNVHAGDQITKNVALQKR